MIFDDSHEHEVVHDGSQDRYVLYASSIIKGLGQPTSSTCSNQSGLGGIGGLVPHVFSCVPVFDLSFSRRTDCASACALIY